MGGDTIASALWRAGISTVSRSFKYHRRRGSLSLSAADAGSLVDADGAPNVCAARALVKNGMRAQSNHCIGGAENDRLAFMQYLSPFCRPAFITRRFFVRRESGRSGSRSFATSPDWARRATILPACIGGGGMKLATPPLSAAARQECRRHCRWRKKAAGCFA